MPQTLLALLALSVATLFATQQQRYVVNSHLNKVRGELAVQSTAVAEDVLNMIGSMAFDEATVDPDAPALTSSSQLTAIADFGSGEGQPNDIDDFHGSIADEYKTRSIQRVDPETGTVVTSTLNFEVDVAISYANEHDLDAPQAAKSKVKKVVVTVYSTDISRPDTVQLARSFVCGSKCDW